MKNVLSFFLLNLVSGTLLAQQQPVQWQFSSKKVGDKMYEVYFTAEINSPWHIYSQYTPTEGPSLPTHIKFSKNPLVEVMGKPLEKGKLIIMHEEVLDVNLKYFADKVEFVQKVRLKGNAKTNIKGSIEFMACTDERCLPPAIVNFNVALN